MALLGNSLMFIANDSTSGFEVWKLEIGTQSPIAITDLSTQYSHAFINSNTLVADGYYFFHAANGISNGLWKTDGTPGGAELVFNPYILPQYSTNGEFVKVGNLIYFSAYDGRTPRLYVTDGTTAGTRRIANFYGDSPSNVNSLTYFKGELYFVASNLLGPELWKTNGTAAGTTFVKPLATDGRGSNPTELIVAGDILYFKIVPSGQSTQLARSDGTVEGTYAIATVVANEFIPFDDRLFLSQYDFQGTELWVSDGTIGPPTLFLDINKLPTVGSEPNDLLRVGTKVFFTANDGSTGRELWVTDGSTNETYLVRDIYSGSKSSQPGAFFAIDNILYFAATDAANGLQIWRSDGTTAGTYRLTSFLNSSNQLRPVIIQPEGDLGGSLYFILENSQRELWRIDGDTDQVQRIKTFALEVSRPKQFVRSGNYLYFYTEYSQYSGKRPELWRTDGTEAGTIPLRLIHGNSSTAMMVPWNDKLIFKTFVDAAGLSGYVALGVTDGTIEGTELLFSPEQQANLSNASLALNVNGVLVLQTSTGLWRYTGGSAMPIQDPAFAGSNLFGGNFLVEGDHLYFRSTTRVEGPYGYDTMYLYRYTVTTNELSLIYKERYTNVSLDVAWMSAYENAIIFRIDALHSSTRGEFLISDGTENGTTLLSLDTPDGVLTYPNNFTRINDQLLVVGMTQDLGREIYKFDRITPVVKIDGPATASGSPTSFVLSVAEYWPLFTHPAYTYFIDWEGDGIEDFSLSSSEPITVTHTYPPGVFEMKVRAVVLGEENPIEPASWTIRNPAPSIRVISAPLQAVPYEPLNVTLAMVGFSANGVYPIGVDYDDDGVYDSLFPLTQPTETITLQLPRWNFVSKIRFDFLDARGIAATTSVTLQSRLAETRVIDGKIVLVVGGTAANDELIVSTNEYGTTILSQQSGSSNPEVSYYSESVSQVIIYAGPGNDLVDASSFDGTVFVEGGGGNDTIIGTLAPDTLFGGLGNDSIDGGAGDDLIIGDGGEGSRSKNLGHDTIYGGEGNDTIYGDRVTGDSDGAEGGNDLLYGDEGDDFIDARTGKDTVFGNGGNDTTLGGQQVDAISNVDQLPKSILTDIALAVDDEEEPVAFPFVDEKGSGNSWPTVDLDD